MADDQNQGESAQPTFRGTLFMTNSKIILAFFLVILAFVLIVLWMKFPPQGDGNMLALLAGFVTLFLTMAKSAVDYQFSSSASSDKKDDTLAKQMPTPPVPSVIAPAPAPAPAPGGGAQPWWSKLTDSEKTNITNSTAGDPRVAAVVTAMQVGAATPDDLAYLVAMNLLTQARADEIKRA